MDAPGLAVVTGASSGIGEAFARDLARRGHSLLLVARRAERLETLAAELSTAGREVRWVACDLATDGGRDRCRAAVDEAGVPPAVVVLNAGFGSRGSIDQLDRERELQMVRLNVEAVVDLACHVLPGMRARGRGLILTLTLNAISSRVTSGVDCAADSE